MSDPNQPYGAIPPPSVPPPGPPPTGPFGGPPGGPPSPPPPAPAGASGKGNALWIALAVIGALLLIGIIVVGAFLLLGGDEDADAATDGTTTSNTPESPSTTPTDPRTEDLPTLPDPPTDFSTFPTDLTVDPPLTVDPTDQTPGQPRGTSTADQVANEPAAVVEAFIKSVFAGDCATAEDLVTKEYLREEGGGCDPADVPSDLKDEVDYTVGKATVNDAAGTATVPVTISAYGESEKALIELQKVGGRWLISGDGED